MRVLLLNPPAYRGMAVIREGRCEQRSSSFHYNMVPISLLTTAALLKEEGHDVSITDAIARRLSAEEVVSEARLFSPGLVLVNLSTVSFRGDAAVAALIKDALPKTFVAGYGVHVTALPGESLAESAFDGVIRREPEVTAAALARALEGDGPLEGVEGLSFRRSGRREGEKETIVHNPDRPFLDDLDRLPFPAREMVDHALYPAPVSRRPHTLVITSRGCPHSCTFCTAHIYYGSQLRLRDPDEVGREIEEVHRSTGLDLFTFWSDTFTLNRSHVLAICRQIEKRGLSIDWMCNSRVDRVDREMLRAMAAAGCKIISFGVESGSQEILDNVGKGITIEQVENAFHWCREAGLQTAAHIILGLPGETPGTVKETTRLVRRIRPDYVQFYGAIPFPGTRFYEQARREGWLITEDWDDFELNRAIVSTPGLSADQLRRCRRRAYLSFYTQPRFIASRLAEIRSPADLGRLSTTAWGFVLDWIISPGKE